MNTSAMQPAPQGGGCGPLVVFMIATLTLVLGILLGVGGLFGFLKSDANNINSLGIEPIETISAPVVEQVVEKECPPCEKAAGGVAPTSAYALVYPIEETLRIEGEINKDALREYVIKHRSELQQCYKTALEKDPTTKGEATLQFTISKQGKIIAAVTRQDTVNNEELKECMLSKVKKWNFKEAKIKSDMVVIKLDILFAPLGAAGF